ncbi:MAG: TonB-dependent receptor [Desulfuromonadales bacterium]|nr:TonB-dependent receptor [Desulfuromonadales bacterium]
MNRNFGSLTIGLGLTLLLAAPAGGEQAVMLEEVVVTASRMAEETATVPASVTVIGADEIAGSTAQTVPELLKGIAGIDVADFTGTGRTTRVDIRGFGETAGANTLVLVDGRRINSPDLSGTDWTSIPLNRIERIEIVRGGGSVLYGNNATGGVINILTRQGAPQPTLSVETTFGSYGYAKQALGLAGRQGNWSLQLDGSYTDTDGYRDNGEFRNKTTGASLAYDADRYGMRLSAGYKDDRYGLPGAIAQGERRRSTTSPDNFAETRERYVQLTPYLLFPDDSEFSVALRGRKADSITEYAGIAFGEPWQSTFAYDLDDYGISPQYRRELTLFTLPHTLVAGVDYQDSDLHYKEGFLVGQDRQRRETGVFIHDKIALHEQLFLSLGYRNTRTRYEIDGGASDTFHTDAATLGLAWNYAPGSKLFASYDRAFRTVLLDELGGAGFNEILAPQISRHYQAGISHRFDDRLQGGITLFHIDTRDEIFFNPEVTEFFGAWLGENVNYGRTRRQGVELMAQVTPHEKIKLAFNYTFMDHELRGGPYDGNEIPGVARHSAAARATITPMADLTVDLRARWVGDKNMIGDWNNVIEDDWDGGDYLVTDLMASYKYRPFTFYAGVNNLFDEKYSENGTFAFDWDAFDYYRAIYPSPERNVVGGILLTHSF